MKILLFTFLICLTLYGQSDVPLTLRAQFNGSYGYTIIGNTMNEFDNWQTPSPPCQMLTQSSATLNLAPNQNIVAAYLHWSSVEDGNYNPIINLNSVPYLSNNTSVSFPENNIFFSYFGSFVNVTALIQNTGNGLYTFSNIDLNPILANYCSNGIYYLGWTIIVVYEQSGLPNVQLNVYDGLSVANTYFNNGITNFSIDNLNVIDTNNAQMTYTAYNGSTNVFFDEFIKLNGNTLSNALNPPNNPFNSTNSFTGSTSFWNMDIDTFDISSFINIGDTNASISFGSGFQRFIQTLVTSIRSELPDATTQINQVTGQEICGNRNLLVNYTIANTNSNAVLQTNVPASFYANNIHIQTVNTTSSIPIGSALSLQTTITIPSTIPDTFDLKIVVDNNSSSASTIAESNENNNDNQQTITLIGAGVNSIFTLQDTFCQHATVPILLNISDNGISGSWLPSVIDNQNSGSYVFTPNAGVCILPYTLNTTIINTINPTFNLQNSFCQGETVPILPIVSGNGISGSWSPNVIDNQNSGNYVFTPNAGQCANSFILNVSVSTNVNPTFNLQNSFCQGETVPILPTVSDNDVVGTWSPNVIDNQNSNTYFFTPDAGICPNSFTLNVSIKMQSTITQDLPLCIDENGNPIESTILNSDLYQNGYTFLWKKDNNFINYNTASIAVTSEGIYQLIASDISFGCQLNFIFNVKNLQPLTANYSVSNDFDLNQTIDVEATGGEPPYFYSFNNLPFQENSIYNVNDGGEILVKTKDNSGCYDVSKTITVWQFKPFFTPNGDGFNDTWGIKTNKKIKVAIFDRFGKLIIQLENNEKWDGTFNSQLLPANDYWFVIYYDNKMYRGHFSLKR